MRVIASFRHISNVEKVIGHKTEDDYGSPVKYDVSHEKDGKEQVSFSSDSVWKIARMCKAMEIPNPFEKDDEKVNRMPEEDFNSLNKGDRVSYDSGETFYFKYLGKAYELWGKTKYILLESEILSTIEVVSQDTLKYFFKKE